MKRIKYIALLLLAALALNGCKERGYEYDIPVRISFDGLDGNNIVQIAGGVTDYKLTGRVSGAAGIEHFGIYNANPRTGIAEGDAIPGTEKTFDQDQPKSYDFEYTLGNVESNRALRVIVTTVDGGRFQAGMVVKITPAVEFTLERIIESYDYWYGMYYACWHEGRVYKHREVEQWARAVDISMCEIADNPWFISPASRGEAELGTYKGARTTKFAETTLTAADFEAVKEIDAAPLQVFDPQLDKVEIKPNTVYAFRTADDKKGLILVGSVGSEEHRDLPEITIHNAKIKVKKEL